MSELEPSPAGEDAAPAEEAVIEQAAAVVDDDPLDPEFAADVISVPDSSAQDGAVKLVPLAALTSTRGQLKELKAQLQTATEGSAKAQQLEARIDQLSGQIAQLGPKAQAYDAAVAAQQSQPRQTEPEDDSEAVELAQILDLYTAEGRPDIAKAKKTLALMDKRAGNQADARVAPLAHNAVTQRSQMMLARARATTLPNGDKPDLAALESIWSRLDPALTATKEGAQQAYIAALGYSKALAPSRPAGDGATRGTDGKFVKADLPAPLHTERAGGKDSPSVSLSENERKYIKSEGITEAEYLKSQPAWMKR